MNLLEFQGKQVFRRYGLATPEGRVCSSPDEAESAAEELGTPVVVKAQVQAGGRGKAGGIKVAESASEARKAAEEILGMDISGHHVDLVYLEPAADIEEEYYLSVMHDRSDPGYIVICSAQGGVDIESVAEENPEAVVNRHFVHSEVEDGLDREVAKQIVSEAQIPEAVRNEAADLVTTLVESALQADALLMEINPLVRTADDELMAVDSKVRLDGNAMFRHDEYEEYEEFEQKGDDLESRAKREGIEYVKLDGNIGVLGNGAGLVMATIDVVAQAGGKPANFLDVGGGAGADVMAKSLDLVLSDESVQAVLINIYGGITRGDEIANGILEALERLGDIEQKLVVRIDGTNAEEGRSILQEADHPNIVAAKDMQEAAEKAVELAGSSS